MPANPRAVLVVTSTVSLPLLGEIPNQMSMAGWDVHCVVGDHPKSVYDVGPAITLHCIPMARNPAFLRDFRSALQAVRLLFHLKPQLLIAGTPKASAIFLFAAWLVRVPARVNFLLGLRLETVPHPMQSLLWIIERFTTSFSTEVIAVSPSLMSAFLRRKLCSQKKITVLGFGSSKGVNLERFRPPLISDRKSLDTLRADIGLEPTVPVIGFVGRLSYDKGIKVLDRARVALSRAGIDHQLILVGENEVGSELSWSELPGLRRPIYIGSVPDVAAIYRVIDILCLPTLREGLPNVCLEAGASSVPVVTTNATGAVDAIEPGVTGLLAEKGSSSSLAQALSFLLTNPVARREMGAKSRIWVQERFDEDLVVGTYLRHFNTILPNTSRHSFLGHLES